MDKAKMTCTACGKAPCRYGKGKKVNRQTCAVPKTEDKE